MKQSFYVDYYNWIWKSEYTKVRNLHQDSRSDWVSVVLFSAYTS